MMQYPGAEGTKCDFKQAVEIKKPKSWLKSISAFANGIGGRLIFGIDDNQRVIGIDDVQKASEDISRLIKERIIPLPLFSLSTICDNSKNIIILTVEAGRMTPYYYKADGVMEAYIRVGNESIIAPNHILNELVLKGKNQSFDAMISDVKKDNYSFTLLEATYFERTLIKMEAQDYYSFGLMNKEGFLTNAGKLFTDQKSIYNSRIFCTRWNGLEKGSIFDDAIDDKEYEGNLIFLLQNAAAFIRNNSKVRFNKEAEYRIDKPDYAERAITEALVNALIHRDYIILGSEIHVDMYDDRIEIWSPGGMFDGRLVQDCDVKTIGSFRRNPIIADLFHRMRFMERRGSGLKNIICETEKLPGYTEKMKPKFLSNGNNFIVIIKNANYNITPQVTPQVTSDVDISVALLLFCKEAKSKKEIAMRFGYKDLKYFRYKYIKPLLDEGRLLLTVPDKPNSRNQKYVTKK